MEPRKTALDELVRELDRLFSIHDWDRDPAMSRWVPTVYQNIGYDFVQVFQPDFCQRFNGLMLHARDVVGEVYCAAFPCPEILERLLAMTKGDALLYLHHPIDMVVSEGGFLPIPPDALERLRRQGVSVYVCHAPMDCHDEIGTSVSIAQAFDVHVEQHFARYGDGFAGRIGTIAPTSLGDLVARGKQIFGVDRVEIGGSQPATITRVAIVAGGGDDPELMEEAERLGAQAYVTGEWYTRTMPRDEKGAKWATTNRTACKAYAEMSKMALLGFSHAATEYLVMKNQMAGWFEEQGMQAVCLEQSDWWR